MGIHVRHGDKSYDVQHQGSYFGGLSRFPWQRFASHLLHRYVERADVLANGDPIARKFYLSTDDSAVVDEALMLADNGLIALTVDQTEVGVVLWLPQLTLVSRASTGLTSMPLGACPCPGGQAFLATSQASTRRR